MRVLGLDVLKRLLRYEPETGKLFWRPRTPDMFRNGKHSAEHTCAKWNANNAGKEAFAYVRNGYKYGVIYRVKYQAHRVIWFMVTGSWPDGQIDHINGNRADNRFENFRCVSHAENGRNQRLPRNNTSGAVGVCWSRFAGKWQASITVGGTKTHIGYFDDFDEAVAARQAKSEEFGFHPNHGRIAA